MNLPSLAFRYLIFQDIFILAFVLFVAKDVQATRRVTTTNGNVPNKTQIPSDLRVPPEWQILLDPNKDEFWYEGNSRPDAGWLLWAKNPTIENAKLYLIRMNIKRDRVHLMQSQAEAIVPSLVSQGIIADDYGFAKQSTDLKKSTEPSSIALEGVHVFFLFSPTCPHCLRQAEILKGLANVTPMQAAGDKLRSFDGLPPSIWAEKSDLEKYSPDKTVPVLLIYSSGTNKMVTSKGVHTLSEIQQIANSLNRKEK